MNLDIVKKEFDNYVSLFDNTNYDISYKYKHSYRVMELSKKVANSLSLSDEEILLATIIGLLHDIGRFKQLEMFGSYNDANVDHADLGAKILFEDNIMGNFNIDKKYYDIIKFSIKNHNKFSIEDTDDNQKLLQAKIIRDADKLDILKAFVKYKDYKLSECNLPISKDVEDSFYSKRSVKVADKKNKNDNILLILSFIFDINFSISFNYIKEEKLLEDFYESIENKELFRPYFEYAINYLNERID